jgi:superfamily II DNA or RNA helicase
LAERPVGEREGSVVARPAPIAPAGRPVPLAALAELRFRYPFRRYQQMVLDLAEGQAMADAKFHVVAPPGSGKTIVGLELIRRLGRPAVVFCPTTTIQQQWREKVGLFAGDGAWLDQHVSLDPGNLAEINILTYQVLSTPGENLEFVERIAVERWIEDLLAGGKVAGLAAARQRIATLQQANPGAYRREVSKRYRRVKREFLRQGGVDGRQFLHPNARALVDRIVALGTGTVVLDECHHLLDYWAFILRELIKALPGVRVVGLTATLPDPSNPTEYENYHSLLGDVDFEVPTPAVVKEGNLAPYRDLVYFCEPSPREHDYLRRIQQHFEGAVRQVTGVPAFQQWLWQTLFAGAQGPLAAFESAFRREPLLCIAGVKYLLAEGRELPPGVPLIDEMLDPLAVDDWLTLLEHFGLRVLKVSAERELQAVYRDLRDALLPFGITITERGIRHGRSPGDLVLALSEAKDRATVEILRAEAEAQGRRLRAVVITDYERLSARTRRLKGVLDPDAGSAVRVFRQILAEPATAELDPVLVTGKVVLVGAANRPLLEGRIRQWARGRGDDFRWEWRPTKEPEVLELTGSGRDWSSRTYVTLLTDLFEQGVTRCLVGTRGIFGEGWDALRLNTLVDLTSVTTRTGVQQIRGRTLRLDPAWRRKVAHNWDVVCVSRRFDKGDSDLRRFVARHAHTWGVVVSSRFRELTGAVGEAMGRLEAGIDPGPPAAVSAGPEVAWAPLQGRIVRGIVHVDPQLALELATRDFRRVRYRTYTRRMLAAVRDRDRIYDLWGVGQPYENFSHSATHLDPQDLKFRTVYTIRESLRAMTWRVLVNVLATAGVIWFDTAVVLPWAQLESLPGLGVGLVGLTALATLGAVGLNSVGIWQVFRGSFLELPADAILLDMGRALLAALRDAGLVSPHLNDNYVRVVETEGGGYEVFVDYASPEDSDTFSRAFRQMMGPLGDARYLIERDSSTLRNLVYRPLWLLVRTALGLGEDLRAYHRVPDVLATRRERAEALAHYWQQYVGGGRLVYTRSDEGRRVLLQARAQQRRRIRQMAFEIWR